MKVKTPRFLANSLKCRCQFVEARVVVFVVFVVVVAIASCNFKLNREKKRPGKNVEIK